MTLLDLARAFERPTVGLPSDLPVMAIGDEALDDEPPLFEVDDSTEPNERGDRITVVQVRNPDQVAVISRADWEKTQARKEPPKGRVVPPLWRVLKRGMSGRDVLAVQRALVAQGTRSTRPTGLYGAGTAKQVRHFQQVNGLHVDGDYGSTTHRKLAPWFDDYGCWLLAHSKPKPPQTRDLIVACAMQLVANRGSVHYTEGSARWEAINNKRRPPDHLRYGDCSSSVTWYYWVAGAPDPNGLNYTAGYTGTLARHGQIIPAALAQPGDLYFYGPPPIFKHVTVAIGMNRCVSHGDEAGPFVLSYNYRSDFARCVRYLPV